MTLARSISWSAMTLSNGTTISAGTIVADAFLEERHDDDSVITENPVEDGSVTNDHKYDLQQTLELEYIWSPSGSGNTNGSTSYLNNVYQQFLTLKSAAVFLTISTGKRLYQNMLVKNIVEVTTSETENILRLRIEFKQLLLAVTQTVTIPSSSQQSIPQKTAPVVQGGAVSLGSAPNYNTGAPSGS